MNTIIDPSDLGPGEGFVITYGDAERTEFSVSSAGDINGDGYDDFVLGPRYSFALDQSLVTYVVFGRATPFTDFDIVDLDPAEGFMVVGGPVNSGTYGAGHSVAPAGDVNGDGIDDLIIGSNTQDTTVIFGSTTGFGTIDFFNPGASGFRIVGGGQAGWSVSSAGDVNNDGFDDVIVGAPYAPRGGPNAGEAYVIFGKATGFGTVDLSDLQDDGFYITGDALGDLAGWSVSSAGDINADGIDDLVVGAKGGDDGGTNAGEAYVIFGTEDGFSNIDLTNLGSAGFIIQGDRVNDQLGASVASAGDVNGDGIDDLIIGADRGRGGKAYVVFGHEGDFENIDLARLGSAGFVITGGPEHLGWSVSSAGDFNGDGYDDLVVGAPGLLNGETTGTAYLIFGHAGGFPAIDVSDLQLLGLEITGPVDERLGWSAASAGDINGDGYDDLIISAPSADADFDHAYVIYGSASYLGPDGDNTVEGNAAANRLSGIGGDDTLLGYGGDDTLLGGTGNDTLYGHDGADLLSGEDGTDRLYGGLLNDTLSGGAGNDTLNGQDGNDTLDGGTGGDAMRGGTGDDSYIVDSAGDTVLETAGDGIDRVTAVIDYVLSDNVETLILSGAARVGTGNALANRIDGTTGGDTLSGLAGDDLLNGFGGDDALDGGAGADTLYGHDGRDALSGGSENDTLFGGLQRDTLHGDDGNDLVNGQDGNDLLYGDAGNDFLIGGAGDDTMRGGAGDDSYSVDGAGDVVAEQLGQGTDTVTASIDHTLATNVENLVLTGAARHGTGNTLANAIDGTGGDDVLSGLDGNDTLRGNGGGDEMFGGAGDDVLDGGAGRDVMTGGAGRDLFVFDDGDMQAIRDNADRILDFDQAAHERVRLNLIDADTTLAGDQAFAFLGSAAFTGDAGELRSYSLGDGYTYIEADVNGDSAADWYIALTGTITLTAGDFVL